MIALRVACGRSSRNRPSGNGRANANRSGWWRSVALIAGRSLAGWNSVLRQELVQVHVFHLLMNDKVFGARKNLPLWAAKATSRTSLLKHLQMPAIFRSFNSRRGSGKYLKNRPNQNKFMTRRLIFESMASKWMRSLAVEQSRLDFKWIGRWLPVFFFSNKMLRMANGWWALFIVK